MDRPASIAVFPQLEQVPLVAIMLKGHSILPAAVLHSECSMDLLSYYKENPLPFATLLGVKLVSATLDRIVGKMTVRDDLCTRPNIAHGGAIMAFADTLGALATIANLPEGGNTTTIESKTNFIGPAAVGTEITGETTPVHRGRRTMVWQTRITTPEGKLVALVTQTQLVL